MCLYAIINSPETNESLNSSITEEVIKKNQIENLGMIICVSETEQILMRQTQRHSHNKAFLTAF